MDRYQNYPLRTISMSLRSWGTGEQGGSPHLLTLPPTTQLPVISDSGEWAQAIDTQIHLSKGTT